MQSSPPNKEHWDAYWTMLAARDHPLIKVTITNDTQRTGKVTAAYFTRDGLLHIKLHENTGDRWSIPWTCIKTWQPI